MAASVKPVNDAGTDPKAGKPRAKSGVAFPYWDLDKSIDVAKAIHEKAGGLADTAQLATLLEYSGVDNGNFRTRVSAAKMFGLIEQTDDRRLRLSTRGRVIVAPVTPADARRARLDAFMEVELFKKVFDQYNGTTLPENIGLRNLLASEYKIVADRVAPTVRILLDSAEQAGLFEATGGARTKMVMPFGLSAATPSAGIPPIPPVDQTKQNPPPGGGGGDGGGDGGSGVDPAIMGLLRRLPTVGTPLSEKRRQVLIDAFTNVVKFLYPEESET